MFNGVPAGALRYKVNGHKSVQVSRYIQTTTG
jgi:hypothetical protein